MVAVLSDKDDRGEREIAHTLIEERAVLTQELDRALSSRFWDLALTEDRYAIDTENWRAPELPALIRRLRIEVGRLEAALDRLRRNVFGICVDCGEDIDPVHLRVDPLRARCAACERAHG